MLSLARTPRNLTAAAVSFLALLLLTQVATAKNLPDDYHPNILQPREVLVERESFGDYMIEIYGTEDAYFQISHNGKTVYEREGTFFSVGNRPHWTWVKFRDVPVSDDKIPMGKDITGDGIPNLMVHERADVMRGGHFFHLYELGDEFRYLQSFGTGGDEGIDFQDINGDGAMEFLTHDDRYGGLGWSRAEIILPLVIFKFRDGAYQFAHSLMRKPAPTPGELNELIERVRGLSWCGNMTTYEYLLDQVEKNPDNERYKERLEEAKRRKLDFSLRVPFDYWSQGVALVYSGNIESAQEFLEKAMPPEVSEEVTPRVRRLFGSMRGSRYYDQLLELNGVEAF